MKILYLAHRIPYPPNKGDKIRTFNEIKHLSGNHEVHLACLADDKRDLEYVMDLERYCARVEVRALNPAASKIKGALSLLRGDPLSVGYFYSGKLQKAIDSWLATERYDAVICFSSPMAEYVFRTPSLNDRIKRRNPTNP
ncbi:MAG: glycosyl transferase (group I), partial [Deltaproteobacteria bacterium]|nr:glycosyl transferase (group I) [Deltaproteobacteria bacterium]